MATNDLWQRLRGWFAPAEAPAFRPDFGADPWRALSLPCPEGAAPAAVVAALDALLERRFAVDRAGLTAVLSAIARDCPMATRLLIAAARRDLTESLQIYGRSAEPLDENFPWHRGALGPGDDRLYAKRPHRFGFLPRIAAAIALDSAEAETLAGRLVAALEGWQRSAEGAALALAFDSNLAVIQRLLNATWAFMLLGCAASTASIVRARSLILIGAREDVRFLLPRLGSSAPNNHLLADQFAGWFIGALLPELTPQTGLRTRFEPHWLAEFERQTLADGTGFEHSLHYHEYACELATVYVLLARRNGWPVPATIEARLRAALQFQSDLAGPEGSCLAFGDGIEDAMLPLGSEAPASGVTWRIVMNALYGTQLPVAALDAPAVVRACLLTGAQSRLAGEEPRSSSPAGTGHASGSPSPLITYPLGGCHVFHGDDAATRLILRSGPAPQTAIAIGHMHADWLSLYAVVQGLAAIVDAGTFTYRRRARTVDQPDIPWRTYFSGPAAHNGWLSTAGDPLGEMPGDFRRTDPGARVRCDGPWVGGGLAAVHARWCSRDGYNGLSRTVCQVAQDYWLIVDALPPSARPREWEGRLQFDSGWEAQVATAQKLALHKQSRSLYITAADACAELTVLSGSVAPLGGWIAPRYGAIQAAPQVRFTPLDEARTAAWALELGGPAIGRLSASYPCAGAAVFRVETATTTDTVFVVSENVTEVTSAWGMDFVGRLLHVRCERDRPLMLGWSDGSYCSVPSLGISLRAPQSVADLRLERAAGEERHTTPAGQAITIAFPGPYRLFING